MTALRRITPEEAGDPEKLARLLGPFLTGATTAIGGLPQYVIRTLDVAMPDRWTQITLGSGWAKGAVGYANPAYWRDSQGVVHLRGVATSGTYSNSVPAATLPQSCWPAKASLHAVVQRNATFEPAGIVEIQADGDVMAPVVTSVQTGTSTFLSFDGISFDAADQRPQPPVAPFPILFPFGLASTPKSVIPLSCIDTTDSPQLVACPGVRWDTALNGNTPMLRVLDLVGLMPTRRYRIRLLVCAL